MLVYSPTFIIKRTIAPNKVGKGFRLINPTIIKIRKMIMANRIKRRSVEPAGSGNTVPVVVVLFVKVLVKVVVRVGE